MHPVEHAVGSLNFKVMLWCRAEAGWYNAGYIFPEGFASRVNFRSSVQLDQLVCEIANLTAPVYTRMTSWIRHRRAHVLGCVPYDS